MKQARSPQELLNPQVFIQVMEEYGIRPKDLGITRNYKYLIKTGKRRPSRKLVEKLINLVSSRYEDGRLLWAGSSAWKSTRLATGRSRVQIPAGPLLYFQVRFNNFFELPNVSRNHPITNPILLINMIIIPDPIR